MKLDGSTSRWIEVEFSHFSSQDCVNDCIRGFRRGEKQILQEATSMTQTVRPLVSAQKIESATCLVHLARASFIPTVDLASS